MTDDLLPALPDQDFRKVLCVVAHPDDVEYGLASAVARWTAAGTEVAYLLLTRGEAGIDSMQPAESARVRHGEQVASAAVVGVESVTFLDHPDGVMQETLDLRRDIARAIRAFQPDVVVTGSWEVEFAVGLNQADHRVVGLATIDAVRDAGNRWVFTDLTDEGLMPWSVRWILAGGHTQPTHGVDVTGEPLEKGIASLEAHAQYLASIEGHPPVRPMISAIAAIQGKAMGVEHAVLFRAWDLEAPPAMLADALS